MIPFDIQGVMINEPEYEKSYVKFLIKHKSENNGETTIIPVSIFRNKFSLDYKAGDTYKLTGGFDSIPVYKKGFFLVYNAKRITIVPK